MAKIATDFVLSLELRHDQVQSFDVYPFCLPAVRFLHRLKVHPKITIITGENGAGKSTLIEALAISLGLNAEGGSRNFRFNTWSSHSELNEYLRVAKGVRRPKDAFFFRAESFFNVATEIEELDAPDAAGRRVIDSYGGKSLHEQSHGESFMSLLNRRFRAHGLYLLDEPEAALSPQRQLAAFKRIYELALEGSQFVIATHSPILMAFPQAFLYQISDDGIRQVQYTNTQHFRVMHEFTSNPGEFIKALTVG